MPEIADGLVEIRGVAREPGYRSKIAVESHAQGVDPVGACVGPRGSRVRMVVSELARREDRHHPVEQRAGALRREGAVAGARARGLPRRRGTRGDGRRPRRPARARDRQGRHERPPRRAPHRLEDRHPERHRVRAGGGRGGLRRRRGEGGGLLRPLRRDPRERQALPERGAARLAVLRRAGPPGARGHRHATTSPEHRAAEPRPRRPRSAEEVGRSTPRSRSTKPSLTAEATLARPMSAIRRPPRRRAGGVEVAEPDTEVPAGIPVEPTTEEEPRRLGAACGAAPAAAGARRSASCSASRPATASSWPGRERARPRRVHVPQPRVLRASGGARQFARVLRQQVRVEPGTAASLHWRRRMANGGNRPNRPLRPRGGGGAGGRRRRVVIDQGAARPRDRDQRQARPRRASAASRSAPPAAPPTGPVSVESGVSVRDLSQALGVLDAGDHQDPHGPRPDAHGDAVAERRGGRADRGRAQARGHDQARRRRGGGAGGVRRPRGDAAGAAAGRDDHGPRRPRQDDAARRDPQRDASSPPRPAASRSTSARTRSTSTTAGRSPSSTRRATRRSPRCAPAARR